MLRTDDKVYARARRSAQLAGLVTLLGFGLAGIWLWMGIDGYVITQMPAHDAPSNPVVKTVVKAAGAWLANYHTYPLAMLAPATGLLGALGVVLMAAANRPVMCFANSALSLVGIIMTAGVSLFPFVMPSSSNPSHSLTLWDAASSHLTLTIMFWAAAIFVPIILAYTIWCYKALWSRVTVKYIQDNDHSVY
jgi:cytochrome d ubiquinol oxidase subunit II